MFSFPTIAEEHASTPDSSHEPHTEQWAEHGDEHLPANAHGENELKSAALKDYLFHTITDNTAHPFATFTIPLPFTDKTFSLKITKHVILLWIAAVLALVTILYISRKLSKPFETPTRFQSAFEIIIDYLREEILNPLLGKSANRYLPFALTIFFFILYINLLGLIPEFPLAVNGVHIGGAASANISVTAGLALTAFAAINVAGMIEKGPLRYWVSLVPHGVPWWLGPLVWLIEFLGLFIKAFALTIRLFANMVGGHMVIIVFLFLAILFQSIAVAPAAILFAAAIMMLELLVAFVQAYVFTYLSTVFISMAIHEH